LVLFFLFDLPMTEMSIFTMKKKSKNE